MPEGLRQYNTGTPRFSYERSPRRVHAARLQRKLHWMRACAEGIDLSAAAGPCRARIFYCSERRTHPHARERYHVDRGVGRC